MVKAALFLSLLVSTFNYSVNSDVQISDTSLQEHVKKLDEMLAEMQSHAQAQEQKYSAVLSSLLSQLTQTTSKLEDLETRHNETILTLESINSKLEEKDAEISKLITSHNETISRLESTLLNLEEKDAELLELKTNCDATASELHELRDEYNETVGNFDKTMVKLGEFENRPDLNGYIGFQGRAWLSKNVSADQPIPFDRIMYNTGTSHDQSIGKFLIPMNGTYLIWLDLSYRQTKHAPGFKIRKDDDVIDTVFGSLTDPKGTSSSITMSYLLAGESIWVTPARDIFLDYSYCNFGIVLLNAH